MKVEMGKRYRTRDGRDVEIYGTDFTDGGRYRVAGAILGESKKIISRWDINGSYGCASSCDLIEVTEPVIPEGFTAWGGGECPVDPKCNVEVLFRSGKKINPLAGSVDWNHEHGGGDIIAYRVVTPTIPEGFKEWKGHSDMTPAGRYHVIDCMLRNGRIIEGGVTADFRWNHTDSEDDVIAWRYTPPKYRPFKNADEFMPFFGKPFTRKGKTVYSSVSSFSNTWVEIEGDMLSWKEFFDHFEFHGGNPAGVRI